MYRHDKNRSMTEEEAERRIEIQRVIGDYAGIKSNLAHLQRHVMHDNWSDAQHLATTIFERIDELNKREGIEQDTYDELIEIYHRLKSAIYSREKREIERYAHSLEVTLEEHGLTDIARWIEENRDRKG